MSGRCEALLLATWQAEHPDEGAPVLLSAHAGIVRKQSEANVSRRLKTAIKHANGRLDALGIERISESVTPHSLRRTFASVKSVRREDPVYIAAQLGHEDARFTLNVYAKAVKRRAKLSAAYLTEYDRALAWAALATGVSAPNGTTDAISAERLAQSASHSA